MCPITAFNNCFIIKQIKCKYHDFFLNTKHSSASAKLASTDSELYISDNDIFAIYSEHKIKNF
jgi:hypothetical protein